MACMFFAELLVCVCFPLKDNLINYIRSGRCWGWCCTVCSLCWRRFGRTLATEGVNEV